MYRPFPHIVCHHDFHFPFREIIHRVLAPTIDFGVSFLPAKTFDFGDSHSFDAKLGQRLFDFFELERFDDGFQFFHVEVNSASRGALQLKATRSTRSLSNGAIRLQSRIFARWMRHSPVDSRSVFLERNSLTLWSPLPS